MEQKVTIRLGGYKTVFILHDDETFEHFHEGEDRLQRPCWFDLEPKCPDCNYGPQIYRALKAIADGGRVRVEE